MSREFEIHSGRRMVKIVLSSSPLQAAIDHVRSYGSSVNEITILGPDTVSWRGARFVSTTHRGAEPDVCPLHRSHPRLWTPGAAKRLSR